MKKELEKLEGKLFTKTKIDRSKVLGGLLAAYNTYATSGAGGDTPPAGTASDNNDLGTGSSGADWINLYPNGYSKRDKTKDKTPEKALVFYIYRN